ncbi:MAG: hypothetical protein LQ346_000118 [Caloplaca aetnensis]|nr:MAG: hypothetical protein LQ346_000118 [Caloplaca aetnensis]
MSPSSLIPFEISGYRILPLSLPPLPSFRDTATHYLYLQPHQPKLPTPTAARSLFLVNVPFDATELHIKNLLSIQIGLPHGRLEEIQFAGSKSKVGRVEDAPTKPGKGKQGKKRKRGQESGSIEEVEGIALPAVWDRELRKKGLTAVAIFVDRPSMDAAFKAVKRIRKDGTTPVWGEGSEGKIPALGDQRYINHHRLQYPARDELLDSVNAYMTEYAAREAAQARLQARQRQVPDEEGFITVTKGGRNGPARQENAQDLVVKQKEKRKGLEDFYRFQHREKKKEKAAELTRQFEQAQEKVKKMKERRGTFKVSRHTDLYFGGCVDVAQPE